jgi:hypothetical protein
VPLRNVSPPPGLRIIQVAAITCVLLLAGSLLGAAARVPDRLLVGWVRVVAILVLVAPYLSMLWLIRMNAGTERLAPGLLLLRATGWATLVVLVASLALALSQAGRTGQGRGVPETLFTSFALLPAVVALLVGGKKLRAAQKCCGSSSRRSGS